MFAGAAGRCARHVLLNIVTCLDLLWFKRQRRWWDELVVRGVTCCLPCYAMLLSLPTLALLWTLATATLLAAHTPTAAAHHTPAYAPVDLLRCLLHAALPHTRFAVYTPRTPGRGLLLQRMTRFAGIGNGWTARAAPARAAAGVNGGRGGAATVLWHAYHMPHAMPAFALPLPSVFSSQRTPVYLQHSAPLVPLGRTLPYVQNLAGRSPATGKTSSCCTAARRCRACRRITA